MAFGTRTTVPTPAQAGRGVSRRADGGMMEAAKKEHFWRGPINSPRRAKLIVSWAGGVFFVFGMFGIAAILSDLSRGDNFDLYSYAIMAVVFLLPASFSC